MQKLENLDDYSCPKIQDLVGGGKTKSCWIFYGYLFITNQGFNVPGGKQMYGEWAMQYLHL